MRWLIPSKLWLRPPSPEADVDYQGAVAWARDFTPDPGKDSYSAALDHAKRKYDQGVSHFDGLDRKADELVRHATTIAALFVPAIMAFEIQVTGWLTLSFLSFLLTAALAAIARRPTPQPTPGSVREVLGFVDDFRIRDRFQIEALLAASIHCASVGLAVLILWKAEQLSRATALFVLGLLLLLPALL